MEEEVLKIQKRKTSMFVTIPKIYAAKIKNATHLKSWENERGNLEYEVLEYEIREKEVEQDEQSNN